MYLQNISGCNYLCCIICRYMEKAEITAIEQYVIDKVREIRKEKGISQRDLAAYTNLSFGFIGDVESPRSRAKYNLQHINEIAKAFECSPRDLLPEKPLD
jgi:predicted transcriptional regulator